jgi:hypothetical protein
MAALYRCGRRLIAQRGGFRAGQIIIYFLPIFGVFCCAYPVPKVSSDSIAGHQVVDLPPSAR